MGGWSRIASARSRDAQARLAWILVTVLPGGTSPSSQIEFPPGGILLAGARRTDGLALARFGAAYGYRLQPPDSGRLVSLRIPPDEVSSPWKLLIVGGQRPIEACALAGSAPPA